MMRTTPGHFKHLSFFLTKQIKMAVRGWNKGFSGGVDMNYVSVEVINQLVDAVQETRKLMGKACNQYVDFYKSIGIGDHLTPGVALKLRQYGRESDEFKRGEEIINDVRNRLLACGFSDTVVELLTTSIGYIPAD